ANRRLDKCQDEPVTNGTPGALRDSDIQDASERHSHGGAFTASAEWRDLNCRRNGYYCVYRKPSWCRGEGSSAGSNRASPEPRGNGRCPVHAAFAASSPPDGWWTGQGPPFNVGAAVPTETSCYDYRGRLRQDRGAAGTKLVAERRRDMGLCVQQTRYQPGVLPQRHRILRHHNL